MVCIKCGKKLNNNEDICKYCGKTHPDAIKPKITRKKTTLIAISTILLAISIAFLILIFFYSIALFIIGILIKETLVNMMFLILKLILIFVLPTLVMALILKAIGS